MIGMQKSEVKRYLDTVTGKFGFGVQNEAGQRLPVMSKECTGHSKCPLFQQHK